MLSGRSSCPAGLGLGRAAADGGHGAFGSLVHFLRCRAGTCRPYRWRRGRRGSIPAMPWFSCGTLGRPDSPGSCCAGLRAVSSGRWCLRSHRGGRRGHTLYRGFFPLGVACWPRLASCPLRGRSAGSLRHGMAADGRPMAGLLCAGKPVLLAHRDVVLLRRLHMAGYRTALDGLCRRLGEACGGPAPIPAVPGLDAPVLSLPVVWEGVPAIPGRTAPGLVGAPATELVPAVPSWAAVGPPEASWV